MIKKLVTFSVNCLLLLVLCRLLPACSGTGAPDVAGIKASAPIGRFDKYLFEETDTLSMVKTVRDLQAAFPYFTNDFISNILGLPTTVASTTDSVAYLSLSELKRFIQVSKPLYDSLSGKFSNLEWLEKELTQSFKYTKYYFPGYKLPKVVTYVGPFNAPGIAITNEALAIGLQLYAGKDFSFYTSTEGMEMFPLYISRTFEPQYITANCMKAIAADMFPDKSRGKALVEQMIEKGKQWWLLEKLVPGLADSIKTGYTRQQLNWCGENEGLVWNFFLQSNYLYNAEFDIVKTFIGEAPNTQGMPDVSPGNIGQWVGWRIVEKYATKNPGLSPDSIMKSDYKKIFSEAKYKPR